MSKMYIKKDALDVIFNFELIDFEQSAAFIVFGKMLLELFMLSFHLYCLLNVK